MANRHKITIYVTPRQRSVHVRVTGVGNVLRVPLSGFQLNIPNLPLPTTVSQKLYLEAIMNIVLTALEAS